MAVGGEEMKLSDVRGFCRLVEGRAGGYVGEYALKVLSMSEIQSSFEHGYAGV